MAVTRANSSGLDLHLDLGAGARGVRADLEHALRDAVVDGRLPPGSPLPASRTLAGDLGIARNTVTEVYGQLVAEGWLIARQGSGTRVAPRARAAPAQAAVHAGEAAPARYDLRAGFPDVTSFPSQEWLSATRTALADAPAAAFGYGPPDGQPVVRAALAEYLGRARGVAADADRIVVCAGFAAGLRLVAGALRARGVRRVGVESHGHAAHRAILRSAGLVVVPLEVDDEGAVPDSLAGLGAVLLSAAHQFPLGMALSPARRSAFAAWAVRTGATIIEDDYDGEFRYDRRAPGALQALAPDHVVYAGTASKTLAPGVRLGWLAVPGELHGAIDQSRADQSAGVAAAAAIEQLTLAEFLRSGRYDRHVRRSRLVYRRRRDRLVAGLARHAPALGLHGLSAGLHTVVSLPDGADETGLISAARRRDLAVEGLSNYAARDGGEHRRRGLVIGYATPPAHAYTAALARLFATLSS